MILATSISGAAYNPTFDANGNMTRDETGKTYEYDAWNRMVRAKDTGGATIITLEYDAARRRIEQTASGTTRDFYFAGVQVVEERVSGTARVSYVWSPTYVDAIIARDRDADSNGSLETREYYQQDANQNVTAVISTAGAVLERYVHTAYGVQTVLNASWSAIGGSTIDVKHGHQGLYFEAVISQYYNRARWYSPSLGRFTSMDLIFDSTNWYQYVGNGPVGRLDPSGLDELGWPNGARGPHPLTLYGVNSRTGRPLYYEAWQTAWRDHFRQSPNDRFHQMTEAVLGSALGSRDYLIEVHNRSAQIHPLLYVFNVPATLLHDGAQGFVSSIGNAPSNYQNFGRNVRERPYETAGRGLYFFTLTWLFSRGGRCRDDGVCPRAQPEVRSNTVAGHSTEMSSNTIAGRTTEIRSQTIQSRVTETVGRDNAPLPRPSPNQLGQIGEQAVGITGPKTPISIFGRTRIPERLTATVISEVKNVLRQSYTRQLRDLAAFAQQNRLVFELFVRSTTRISGPLREAQMLGEVILRIIPGT